MYYEMAKKYHPDRGEGASNAERFKRVAEAYEVLGDKEKRSDYDVLRSLHLNKQRPAKDKVAPTSHNDLQRGMDNYKAEQGWSYTYDSQGNKIRKEYQGHS